MIWLLGFYLHHNFICALLNDLFGIQSHSMSALDHPQAIELFNISDKDVKLYTNVAMQSDTKRAFKVILPGFVQIHLPWFFSQDEVIRKIGKGFLTGGII